MAFDCPKNFLRNHSKKYSIDFGVGMMLKGGGQVAPILFLFLLPANGGNGNDECEKIKY
jgi:hypothetical protein